jgi:pimeloyl-ACP methyl ester carboxylesterase
MEFKGFNKSVVGFSRKASVIALLLSLVACGGGGSSNTVESSNIGSKSLGVISITSGTQDGQIYGIMGKPVQAPLVVTLDSGTSAEDLKLSIANSGSSSVKLGPFGWVLETVLIAEGFSAIDVTVTNIKTGNSQSFPLKTYALSTIGTASGKVTKDGGVVLSASGAQFTFTGGNNLTSDVTVSITEAVTPRGEGITTFEFSQDISASNLKLVFPSNNEPTVTSIAKTISTKSTTSEKTPFDLSKVSAYATHNKSLGHLWSDGVCSKSMFAEYFSDGRLPTKLGVGASEMLAEVRRVSVAYGSSVTTHRLYSAELYSIAPCPAETLDIGTAEPVLFIHGFAPGNDSGGGKGTWANFPQLTKEMGFVPFEFQWKTNARFVDVAGDLAKAIQTIHKKTGGKKVHIVAHSFGGVLVRTLLQGLAKDAPTMPSDYNVASLTTLGSPFSGILSEPTATYPTDGLVAVSLPKGRDSSFIGNCFQISCYVLGEASQHLTNLREIYGVLKTSGEHAASLHFTSDRLPAIRIGVGIGLVADFLGKDPKDNAAAIYRFSSGDGLISFEGQRFSPSSGRAPIKAGVEKIGNAEVREWMLTDFNVPGAFDGIPGSQFIALPLQGARKNGYAHTSANPTLIYTIDGTVSLGYESAPSLSECPSRNECEHAGVFLFQVVLGLDGGSSGSSSAVAAPASPFPQAPIVGSTSGGGQTSTPSTPTTPTTTPTTPTTPTTTPISTTPNISSLSLASVPRGVSPVPYIINGSNFTSGAYVFYSWLKPTPGTSKRTATFTSSSRLTDSFTPGSVVDTISVKVCTDINAVVCSNTMAITVY